MKIQNNVLAFIILFITCMATVKAEAIIEMDDSVNEVVAETTKYYKTVTILNNSEIMTAAGMGELSSLTTEISKEEYMNAPTEDGISPYASVTTEYKKLTSTISKYSTQHYQYKVTLDWRNMPATRSYDIIGVGFYASVSLAASPDFNQSYCNTDGNCYSQNVGHYSYRGNNGYGAMFQLPSGSLSSLSQSISVLVSKTNSSSTIIEQIAAGDYSHAQKTVSYSNAKDFFVSSGGIVLGSGIYSSYDAMNTATAKWTGTW